MEEQATSQSPPALGQIWRYGADLPEAWQPLVGSLRKVASATNSSINLVAFPTDQGTKKLLSKRRHDLKAALRTLGFAVQALEAGYRFDDTKAAAKIEAIAKAVQVLERESEFLTKVLTTT